MISRKNTFLIIIASCLLSVVCFNVASAETSVFKNGGFPQKGIWYSKDPFFSGDKIRIYSAVYNSSQYELLGTVEFYDNDKGIGKIDFSVAGNGKIKDVWIDWQATDGNHKISAKIISAKNIKAGVTEIITLQNSQTGVDERFIDIDTDNDLIGNTIDNDDDNDGRTDVVEIQQDTDPLKKDSPPPANLEAKLPSATSTSPILSVVGKTVDFVITAVKTTTKAINKIADSQSKKIEAKKEIVQKEIEEIKIEEIKEEESSKTEKPLKYAYLTALSLAGFVLNKKILLYLILAFVLYKLLKFAYKKILKKQKF